MGASVYLYRLSDILALLDTSFIRGEKIKYNTIIINTTGITIESDLLSIN